MNQVTRLLLMILAIAIAYFMTNYFPFFFFVYSVWGYLLYSFFTARMKNKLVNKKFCFGLASYCILFCYGMVLLMWYYFIAACFFISMFVTFRMMDMIIRRKSRWNQNKGVV